MPNTLAIKELITKTTLKFQATPDIRSLGRRSLNWKELENAFKINVYFQQFKTHFNSSCNLVLVCKDIALNNRRPKVFKLIIFTKWPF